MARDVMREWTRAMARTSAGQRGAWAQVFAAQRMTAFAPLLPSPEDRRAAVAALRRTRRLRVSEIQAGKKDDIEQAVLILRRNNRLLLARFGIEWPAAASVLCGEAARRGTSVASLARVLTAGLRRDAREGGAR